MVSYTTDLGSYQAQVREAIQALEADDVLKRIWEHDHTVWRPEPDEITNRLGWLTIAESIDVNPINELVEAVRSEGYANALLLGMGGSSLAPELFRLTFGVRDGYLDLAVLDSTDPGTVLAYAAQLDLAKTLFIVASKSGGTAETLSFFKYFYNHVVEEVGKEKAGEHFAAVTDPGSRLVKLGEDLSFRQVFINDPNIGGRYSALSYFGLVAAGLVGVDLPKLLASAKTAMGASKPDAPIDGNIAAHLGVTLGVLANEGRNKLTMLTSPQLESFGDWAEQLIAESTGKEGKGILPVVSEPIGSPAVYGDDRVFVYLKLGDDATYEPGLKALSEAGHPIIEVGIDDLYDLGGQFLIWELATAIAGWRMGIQPFDQPNVEAAKVLARKMIEAYTEEGKLPEGDVIEADGEALKRFLASASPGDYVTLQAFVHPTERANEALEALRLAIRDYTKLATTAGYGPRYLHSTGQLHKGDAGRGLFIQFVSTIPKDAPIPDEAGESGSAMTFGVLKNAQALGDAQALRDGGRRILRFDLGEDVAGALKTLTEVLT